jgi:uncharacterized membrane protein
MKKKRFLNFNQFDTTDLIAILIIVGGFLLMWQKIDTVVGGVVTMTAGYYFGRKAT